MNLATKYLGLMLKNPLVAGASPVTRELGNLRHLEDCGAGAVVLPSIFEEQIGAEKARKQTGYHIDPAQYLDFIRQATQAVDIPVIASINGITDHHWVDYARQIEAAGAAALELNIYLIPADIEVSGYEVEQRYVEILRAVKSTVQIPVAVKLSPYFSSIGNMALLLDRVGADGLVLFNRFYEPDIDIFELKSKPTLMLSQPEEVRLPLLWIGALAGRLGTSLAASTGVETAAEVTKYILAGADVVMTTSALLRHGPEHMRSLVEGLELWMASRDLDTLEGVRGSMSQRKVVDPEGLVRENYIKVLQGSSRWT